MQVGTLTRPASWLAGMVFSGTDLSAIFAAAEANDQTLTEGIWTAHNGDQLVTYAQCRRRYNSYKKKREADDEEGAAKLSGAFERGGANLRGERSCRTAHGSASRAYPHDALIELCAPCPLAQAVRRTCARWSGDFHQHR